MALTWHHKENPLNREEAERFRQLSEADTKSDNYATVRSMRELTEAMVHNISIQALCWPGPCHLAGCTCQYSGSTWPVQGPDNVISYVGTVTSSNKRWPYLHPLSLSASLSSLLLFLSIGAALSLPFPSFSLPSPPCEPCHMMASLSLQLFLYYNNLHSFQYFEVSSLSRGFSLWCQLRASLQQFTLISWEAFDYTPSNW